MLDRIAHFWAENEIKKHLTASTAAEKEAKKAKKAAKKQKSAEKSNNGPDGMTNTGRRTSSVTAQISRQARRFSTAIAPTLTKIEAVHILQKLDEVRVKMNDVAQPWSPMRRKRARSSNPNGCKTTPTTSSTAAPDGGVENNNGKSVLPNSTSQPMLSTQSARGYNTLPRRVSPFSLSIQTILCSKLSKKVFGVSVSRSKSTGTAPFFT
uniref:Uncharacterized protein n=1 Tax=Caenorhabditis tropicalis TaxID=1561998 RepID=A0A1I7V0K0_9PELO